MAATGAAMADMVYIEDTVGVVKKEMKEIFRLSWPVSITRLIICITRLAVRVSLSLSLSLPLKDVCLCFMRMATA